MASPHVAGLLAYLLSIYPSATFDPSVAAIFGEEPAQRSFITSVYAVANAAMPRWASSFIPAFVEAVAPVPPKTLSPEQLKRALLALATPNVLAELPPKTVNLLIFNNYTSSS